jgi:CheY-like chemotaxis protein
MDGKPLNIVLVEDDDGDAKAVQRSFQKAGLASVIQRALDGVDALEMLAGANGRTKPPTPAIFIVDLNMPRMNGIELVRAMRGNESTRHAIVFILTTSRNSEDVNAVYDLNVAGYIIKQMAGMDFLNLVHLLESYWRLVELPQ